MTRLCLLLLAVITLAGCADSSSQAVPPGTWAGSTAADQEFLITVGEEIEVNRVEARYVERGVLEARVGTVRMRLTCELLDNEEELRCSVTTQAPEFPTTTEVIDLMLL